MADNSSRVSAGTESIRTIDKSGIKVGVTALDAGGSGTESLVSTTNGLPVDDVKVSTSTDVSLSSAATSAQALASNASRRGLMLTNTDANDVYLYYGTTATATKFSVKIPSGGYWEMPKPIYTGRIDAIWSADGSGALIGSEL